MQTGKINHKHDNSGHRTSEVHKHPLIEAFVLRVVTSRALNSWHMWLCWPPVWGPLHPANVVTSWLKKCLLSLFESRSPGTSPPFNNDVLISDIHIPLYSPQNTNRYRFFRRINSVSTSGQRSLISDLRHLWQKDTNNRDSQDGQRVVVTHFWRWHTRADLQTCPSHVCQDAHGSHLSGPARPHQEAEVCACVWSSMKCHWSNSKETPSQTIPVRHTQLLPR